MQSTPRIIISMFLIATVIAGSSHSGTKLRRDGVLNLYPFPRVGRSSHQTWQIPIHDLLDQDLHKRQLYAFPRVGRSYPIQISPSKLEEILFGRSHGFAKRESESTDSTGMWFGPRLGRGFRSEDETISSEDRSEPEQIDLESEREKRDTKHN
ncbi:CAPA peptides-like [Pieris brassicae]|uniref:Uncharacterized protein n=1 Tax=Pieris brassicae TaxID=7116 RepID=A0A9P0TME4_PIEBR|nr:CAPA peptides-like [Pieris brassicae]CAH4034895.1 unnamed protein product [Pieris brassicae]